MKKITIVAILILAMLMCLTFTGCKSEEAKAADQAISDLSQEEITIDSYDEIDDVQTLIDELTDKDVESLDNMELFNEIKSKYEKATEEEAARIDALISKLPALDDIKLSSEDAIEDVYNEYEYSTDDVQNKVKKANYLEDVKARFDKVKEDAWQDCSTCGGDGEIACELCGGDGSRIVDYTTPNGKTWQVSQECVESKTCHSCYGSGGDYVE